MLASKLLMEEYNLEKDIEITGIVYDSRQTVPGNVFVCIKGYEQDGHKYAKMAEEMGAALIVAQDKIDVNIPVCYVEDCRKTIARMACRFYDNPSQKFKLVGVTGTNGKTTVTYLLRSILETAGKRVGIIGTNENVIGDKILLTKSTTPTTPNSLELQKLFSEMADEGAEYVVMEVSSHALFLDRVLGCAYDVGVFTNLTQDHLDFHKTMENYMEAKAMLFDICAKGAINKDDEYGIKILKKHENSDILTYAIKEDADLVAKNINITSRGATFDVEYMGKVYPMNLCIPGKFSVYNALSAISCAIALNIDMETICEGIKAAKGVTGRVEVVPTNTDYTVIIDYAHTPDGLENIINTVSEYAEGRVITLFGCGGDRDNTKRAVMGEISGKLSDFTIITSDNPRTENPESIIAEIEEGMKKTDGEYKVIVNRREAIDYALKNAKSGDVIILAGKGQETYQIIGKEKFDFDERIVVWECLNNN